MTKMLFPKQVINYARYPIDDVGRAPREGVSLTKYVLSWPTMAVL